MFKKLLPFFIRIVTIVRRVTAYFINVQFGFLSFSYQLSIFCSNSLNNMTMKKKLHVQKIITIY